MDRSTYDLSREIAKESRRPSGQGDGWTLDQHLVEHQRMPTAVTIVRKPDLLMVSHDSPGKLKFWIALGLLVVGAVAAVFAGLIPAFSAFSVTHYAIAVSIIALFGATIYASVAHTRMGINKNGLISRPWPYVPGIGVIVPLKQIRRFKVNKLETDGTPKYELYVLTKDDKEHRLIPHIVLKRDAYLMAMLLIDRVKTLRKDR
jgi:hypothetical protein